MRIQTGQLVTLGYGRYVRSDEVVAVEPITENRGPGRRCLVWIRGVPDPFVSSRSQASIIADLMRPAEQVERRGAAVASRPAPRSTRQGATVRARRPVRVSAKSKPRTGK